MDDLHDALNELAGRGQPRGFDEVFAAAQSEARRAPVAGREAAAPDGDDLEAIPFVTTEPVARRRPLGSLIAAAGIASLLIVGGLAVTAVVGSGGGAGSPEAAVRQLADAISHEDPLAAADVIAPDEVRSLHATLTDAEHKAAELQLVETAGAPLAGVDLNVSGLDLSTQPLADGVAKVTIDAGTFDASTHKAQFSPILQKALHGSKDNHAQADLARLADGQNLPTFVVAVRQSGNWYVSAAYTVLEYVREANRLPSADFGSGARVVASLGADSPDAAVQDSMRALQRRDWSKLLTMVPPSEIPLYDYRAALLALAGDSDTSGGWFTIDSMTTAAQLDGDHAQVTLNAAGTTDSSKWSIKGGCFAVQPTESADAASLESGFSLCDDQGIGLSLLALPLSGLQAGSQVSVVKQDGRWFVSPADTVLDVVDQWVNRLDRRSLYTMLGLPGLLPPDGPLVLGRPVTFAATSRGLRVLSLDARQGEVLIGRQMPDPNASTSQLVEFGSVLLRVYGPDGTEVYDAQGILDGQAFHVPADGRYTFALQHFGRTSGTATVWDYADAPADVQQSSPGGRPTCTYTSNSSSCSSSSGSSFGQLGPDGGVVTPSTYLVGPAPTAAVAPVVPLGGSSGAGSSGSSATSVP